MNLKRLLAALLLLAAAGCGRGIDDSLSGVTTSTAPPATTAPTTTLPVVEITTTTTEPPPPAEPVVVWVDPALAGAVATAASEFSAALGIEVETVPLELADIGGRAANGFAASDPPDLFMGDHRWVGGLVASGLAGPTGLGPRSGEFVAVAADAFRAGGDLLGLPVAMRTVVLYRNTGLAPDEPTGTSQIKSRCEELQADEEAGAGVEQCLLVPTDDVLASLPFLTAPGGYLVGRLDNGDWNAEDVGIDGDAAKQGAAFLAGVVADDVVDGVPRDEALAAFAAGAAPYLIAGPEAAAAFTGVPWAASALPLMGGNLPAPVVDVVGFYLNPQGDQAEPAGILLREHLATPPAMAEMFAATSLAPAFGATAESLAADHPARPFLNSAERGVPMPAATGADAVVAAVAEALAAILVPAGGDDPPTPAALLDAAAAAAREALGAGGGAPGDGDGSDTGGDGGRDTGGDDS